MQALGLFSRRAILGRSNKSTVVLEKIAKENSLNRTGTVNFNKYGKQDGVGFSPCSDKVVDSFLFYVLVPDYFLTDKKTYTEVGHVNKHIRDMLKRYGLQKCKVKAVGLSPLKEQPKADELDKVYGRLKTKETDETVYYVQEFKISCANEKYSIVLGFLRSDELKIRNIFVKDIDVTMNYSGSFDKDEVIHHLTTNKGFRMQGCTEDADKTILDNSDQVGNNCLTYMETVGGLKIRCKIYNKMVQMLESKTVGQQWKDWVCQPRLAKARDLAKDRGLTRAEVTFYCQDTVPSDIVMEDTFVRMTRYVSPSLVYSTPFADTWKAYCDALLHSLVVIDRTRDVGFIVCTYNEMTKNISGQFVHGWLGSEKWCLANLTFSSKLPVDIIEVCDRSKARSGKTKDTFVAISGARYFKSRIDDSTDFPNFFVSNGCWYEESKEEEHLQQLEKAGFVPHKHCTPLFAYVQGRGNRQEEIELHRADILEIKVPGKQCCATKKEQNEQWKDVAEQKAREIRERRKPFEDAIAKKRNELHLLDEYCNALNAFHGKAPPPGSYEAVVMREKFRAAKNLREHITKEMQKERAKMRTACEEGIKPPKSLPTLAREDMVSYKHMKNLAELPPGSTHTPVAIGYIEHYGQERLVVKLADGILYQAGDSLEEQKEQLTVGSEILISNSPTKKKFPVCKVVQRGEWANVLHYEKVPLLQARKKRGTLKVLDVRPVEHKGQKRKLLLTEDGTVYKVKRSKLEDRVKPGQYV